MNTIRKTIIVALACMAVFSPLQAQTDSVNFIPPLNIPLYLAGNYGEIRSGHFHAGLDIKTQQVEGLPVIAVADGYVSRIKISLTGYGNVLYVTHPNGYTTVYAHMQVFNDTIDEWIKELQYAKQKFTVEAFPVEGALPVKQGDTLGLSGNSGGSGGPHLHFEIRDTRTGIPLNPLLFDFPITDNVKPVIKNLAIYPLNDTSLVNGKHRKLVLPVTGSNGNYRVNYPGTLTARGVIGFGIEAIDKMNGTGNRCGVFEVSLTADTTEIYRHQMQGIPFNLSRFINAHVDYYEWKKNRKRVQRSYLDLYNELPIYTTVNKGKVFFSKYGHDMRYTVKDAYGNTSTLAFRVKTDTVSPTPEVIPDSNVFRYDRPNSFSNDNISVHFEPYSFYEDTPFTYRTTDTIRGAVAPVHHIIDLYTPLQKYMTVSIRTPVVSREKGDKFIAVSLTAQNKLLAPEGGTYEKGWITFRTRSLGPYTVMVDSVAPVIVPVNFRLSATNFLGADRMLFKVKDNLSGVVSYNGYIDGEWILMEFDRKTGKMWYRFDKNRLSKGKHHFKLSAGDRCGNTKSLEFDFIW